MGGDLIEIYERIIKNFDKILIVKSQSRTCSNKF